MTISQRIFMVLKQKRLKQKDLAAFTGISTSAISAWNKNNVNPAAENLSTIADFLGVSLNFLITGHEEQLAVPEDINKLIVNYSAVDEISKKLIQERAETLAELAAERVAEKSIKIAGSIPSSADERHNKEKTIKIRFYDYPVSAGTGLFLEETKAEELMVMSTPEAQLADYAIPIDGDSMEDEFHDGDIVLVESCPFVRKGEVGIFLLDGSVFIKEYGGDYLISYNEEKYPPIPLCKFESAACLGRVLGIAEVI